ncbi:hypothetical protein [Microbacterium luticocti]|uniref:hypothetical protein n=1 Tax=Microbacterium luticocti TaxID=451764 RepID=UPI00041F37B9|nr:hypothetical protein [Microbacterium luticocti]
MADPPARTGPVSILRRIVVAVIVVAFTIAAIGGIVVLLGAELGSTAARVIGTTAVVGAFSVALLCCAALLGRVLQPVGLAGVIVSAVAAALVVWTIWYDGEYTPAWENVQKATWTAVTLSAALALACLLLLLADRRRVAVRAGLVVTLALFAVVVAMIVYLIWASDTVDDEIYPRVLGIAAILAALGAVVVPVLSLLLPDARPDALSPAAIARLEHAARARGIRPDDLVTSMLATADPASGGTHDHT